MTLQIANINSSIFSVKCAAPTQVWYLPNAGYTGYGTGTSARYKCPWIRAATGIDFPGFKIPVKQ